MDRAVIESLRRELTSQKERLEKNISELMEDSMSQERETGLDSLDESSDESLTSTRYRLRDRENYLLNKINQALKIIRAAVAASETDPSQAMRAMLTQATTIQDIATDFRLTLAASEFYRSLMKANQGAGRLTREEAEGWARPMLAFLPPDEALRPAEAA